jgi:hypothetical protein
MLRRANSQSTDRLSRRKSTSSIHPKQSHIDPEVARRQAQAAATYAFARAYERGNAEIRRSGEVSRDNSILDQRRVPNQNGETDQGGRGVRRQQSVRFMGPEAITGRRSIGTRAMQGSLEDKAAIVLLRPRALTNNVPIPAAYRPPSRSSSIGKTSIGKGTAQSIVTALAAYDEYYTREDDIASTPSSYRRMRKSKSTRTLSSPSKVAKVPLKDIITGNDYNTRIWNRVPWIPSQQHEAALRAPKSMSFLRGGREHMAPAVREDHDNAVQMARDKFLHQIEQQRLREQPSFLFRAKAKREEKPFPQSVRSGSTNSYGIPVGSANQINQPKDGSLRTKARKASQTIQKKLKELFRRGGDQVEEAKIPDQQVEARTSHGSRSYVTVAKVRQDEFVDIPHPDEATVSRVAPRLPPLHTVLSCQQLKSRNGSVRSQRSNGSGESRVTSWTSTVDNTATSRQAQAEREAQRLSIIQENGAHVSSASFARLGISNQLSAYPMFHRPRSAQRRGGPHPGPVDSQKVYSALMKRLDENSPMAKLEEQRIISGEKSGPAMRIPPRSTSVSSCHSSRGTRTPATIRYVQDDAAEWNDEKQKRDDTVTSLPQEDDDVFSPKPLLNTGDMMRYRDGRSGSSMQRTVTSRVPSSVAYPLLNASEQVLLPPQQQATRNELLMKPSKALRETRSTFFGNSSFTVNRSTSPYRRALAEADYNPAVITGELLIGSGPNRILFAPPVVHCSDPKEVVTGEPAKSDEAYTESVYSRTTSGRVPGAESSQSLGVFQDDFRFGNSGSVVLGDRKTYKPTGPTKSRKPSSASVEKKESLTPEAIMIERSKETHGMISINYALPSMPKYFGHFREHAQITDEETEVSQRKIGMKTQPIGILQQNFPQITQLKPILKHKSSTPLDGFPMPPPPPPPLPPPLPLRSPLRPTQSRSSLRSVDATSTQRTLSAPSSIVKQRSFNGHKLLRPNSLTNINRVDTPAKLIKRTGRPSNNYDPSPGIGAAVERQFGSAGSRTPYSGAENYSPADAARSEHHGSTNAGHRGTRATEAQAMGSRVMVDMFLSSRRRRVAGSDESNAFL